MSRRNVTTLLLTKTSPHRLRIQTRTRLANSLPEYITLHDFVWLPHQSESTLYGLTFSQAVHHHVDTECFRCCWKCCSSQFSRYEASGCTTFLLCVTMCNVGIRQCRVTSGTTMSQWIFERMTVKRRRWLYLRRQAVCSTRERVFGMEFCDVDIRMDMHASVVLSCGTTVFQGW